MYLLNSLLSMEYILQRMYNLIMYTLFMHSSIKLAVFNVVEI